ncbi:hypothetical protein SO694_0012303 [Aureococcus anophagefferens]|uniref:Uncharacterized protein n=1 Tax=Aureococcus anophagefferens TaxID=44056 RepID=A0ABR1FIX8_AURAN
MSFSMPPSASSSSRQKGCVDCQQLLRAARYGEDRITPLGDF